MDKQRTNRRLMSVEDLAEYLGMPVKTLYAWRYTGQGPRGVRLGRHLKYRPESVERWLAAQEQEAGGDAA